MERIAPDLEIVVPEVLAHMEEFQDVPPEQLQWFLDHGQRYALEAGSFLFQKGEEARWMHLILRGKVDVYMTNAAGKIPGRILEGPTLTGVLPFSRLKLTNGYGACLERCEMLSVPAERIPELVRTHYELTRSLVHAMTGRVRQFTELALQNEKMMALGKMSAGLAHELNNPAAAIARSSQTLLELQNHLLPLLGRWQELDLDDDAGMCLMELLQQPLPTTEPGLLARRPWRSALEDLLDDWGSEDSGTLADSLVDSGVAVASVEKLGGTLRPKEALVLVEGLALLLEMRRLSSEVGISARRISDLVGSVKRYTHMDRGLDPVEVDVHETLRDTLTLLNHKVKQSGIAFGGNYLETGPKVWVHPGELGQIWTNLLDNAIDALHGQPDPRIGINSAVKGERIRVEIEDNGPGIPSEVASEMFKPFFTTKEAGKGTGMGLEISRQIAQKMGGELGFMSESGRTVFYLEAPLGRPSKS
ncbi:GHKL domain-containing protein [bacterium]|nr:GHKL domain-containing protein [bacterium]